MIFLTSLVPGLMKLRKKWKLMRLKKKYRQLTYEQRVEICAYLKSGMKQSEIAELIHADKSTVSREIKRNKGLKGYRFKQAQEQALERRLAAAKNIRFTDEIKAEVIEHLKEEWSPEQISGRLKAEGRPSVSHETIYRFIIDDQKLGGELYRHLRLGRKKRRKRIKTKDRRGQIPNRISIDARPSVVDGKARTGDWEIDTVIGKNHKGALVTAVERKTKFSLIGHVARREAVQFRVELVGMLAPYSRKVLTITADNGKENSDHEEIARLLDAEFFFAHPYSSWERGLNENTNGLIRQYLPKKTCLLDVDKEQIKTIQDKLNNRPRKSLNYSTPAELFLNSSVALGT